MCVCVSVFIDLRFRDQVNSPSLYLTHAHQRYGFAQPHRDRQQEETSHRTLSPNHPSHGRDDKQGPHVLLHLHLRVHEVAVDLHRLQLTVRRQEDADDDVAAGRGVVGHGEVVDADAAGLVLGTDLDRVLGHQEGVDLRDLVAALACGEGGKSGVLCLARHVRLYVAER